MIKKTKKSIQGFTLTELMVIAAIVAVLALIAIPGFSMWLPGYKLKSAAQDLYSNIQATKLRAIKESTTSEINFYTAPDRYEYSFSTSSRTVPLEDYGYGVNFDGPSGETFDAPDLSFDPRGFSTGGCAYLSNAEHSAFYRVRVLTTGAVRLEKREGGEWR
ncbi:MAG: prepilin-type N-terminal cleavage/methylation domain-containing protein [Desulfobacteraceae bacterium]